MILMTLYYLSTNDGVFASFNQENQSTEPASAKCHAASVHSY